MSEELAQTMDMGASLETQTAVEVERDEPDVVSAELADEGARAERLESREEVRIVSSEGTQARSVTSEVKSGAEEKTPVAAEESKAPASVEVAVKASADEKVERIGDEGEGGVEAKAAAALRDAYRTMPGVVADLVRGSTVEEVKASFEAAQKAYSDIKAAVLREQGVAVPQARGGSSLPPVPGDPLSMILAGVAQPKR